MSRGAGWFIASLLMLAVNVALFVHTQPRNYLGLSMGIGSVMLMGASWWEQRR